MMYNLAIIGGGPAGYVAAQRAAAAGLKVILFEEKELGGVCLNEGCIPTKTLLRSAHLLDENKSAAKYGVNVSDASIDYAKVLQRKDKITKKLTGAIKVSMRNLGVEVVKARARITGGAKGDFTIETGEQQFHSENLLLCSGSQSFIPPIPGLECPGPVAMSSREALQLDTVPQSLVIIGGGVIGMEFASLFNSLGCKVSVIEALDKILGPIDEEISGLLQAAYQARGVDFHLKCKVCRVEGNKVFFIQDDSTEQCIEGEKILVCVGRRAHAQDLGLESIGLQTERGALKTDCHMQTAVEGIYAAGDITGFSMLAHTASREGEVAVNHILGIEDKMSYAAIPGVVYTHPEVASVGESEQSLRARGIEYKVYKLPMSYSGRFVVENERGSGLCKLICDAQDRLVGAHLIGDPCSEIVSSCCLAIEKKMHRSELQRIVFPHPSVSEIIKETSWSE
ncbi:MAG: dihydrolipoyl dehydrogenase [Candidatus Cryptobacteroides sp.]